MKDTTGTKRQLRRAGVKAAARATTGRTVGIDIGDRHCQYVILDERGEICEEGRVFTGREPLKVLFGKCPPMRIALEAGTHSPWVSRLLEELGHEVLVANPRKLRFIYQSDRKNDKADARLLARVARMDPQLLAPIRHRRGSAQRDLARIRARDILVGARTKLILHLRGAVKSYGGRLPKSSPAAFPRLAKHVPKDLWEALSPLFDLLGAMTGEIKKYDRAIDALGHEQYPETAKLQQVPGVGPLTSLAYVLTLDDPQRFHKSREVGPYLGLVPRQDDSGDSQRQLGITKAGDVLLRRLFVSCAHYILGRYGAPSDLRTWGLKLAARGGKNAKKRAAVAVARKLAVLLHRLWVGQGDYVPLRYRARQRPGEPVGARG